MRSWLVLALLSVVSAAGGVVTATDSTFDSVVLGANKNAFVKFLAPW